MYRIINKAGRDNGFNTEEEAIDDVKKRAKVGDKFLLIKVIRDVEFELVEKKEKVGFDRQNPADLFTHSTFCLYEGGVVYKVYRIDAKYTIYYRPVKDGRQINEDALYEKTLPEFRRYPDFHIVKR